MGVGRIGTPGSLGGVIVSIRAWNARDVGLIPALGNIFPIFITPLTKKLLVMTMILYKLLAVWLNLPSVDGYTVTACIYVIVSIN